MPVMEKIAAGKLKFNAYALPASAIYLKEGLTVGEFRLYPLDHDPQAAGHQAKDKDYAGLIGGFMGHAGHQQRRAIDGPAFPNAAPVPALIGHGDSFRHGRRREGRGGFAVNGLIARGFMACGFTPHGFTSYTCTSYTCTPGSREGVFFTQL